MSEAVEELVEVLLRTDLSALDQVGLQEHAVAVHRAVGRLTGHLHSTLGELAARHDGVVVANPDSDGPALYRSVQHWWRDAAVLTGSQAGAQVRHALVLRDLATASRALAPRHPRSARPAHPLAPRPRARPRRPRPLGQAQRTPRRLSRRDLDSHVPLAFDLSGESGPPVVCLPWFGTSRVMTREALEPALTTSGFRLVVPDLPGHGDSPALAQATSEAVLAAVVAFVEQQVQQPVLIAGCSYGGYVASALARRRPDLVRALLLICPGVRRERDLPPPGDVPTEGNWLMDAPPGLHEHLERALGTRSRAVVRRVVRALGAGGPGDEAYQDSLQGGDGYFFDDDDDDAPFTGPVAVVTGRQDRIVGFADQFRRMSSYPRGTFVTSDLAGHYLPYERQDVLRSVASEWAARCALG